MIGDIRKMEEIEKSLGGKLICQNIRK